MASKRYSPADQARRLRDRLANLRARGVDAHEMRAVCPGGTEEALKFMETETGLTRDQCQEQREVHAAADRKKERGA
jgi:hypothetical protein